MSDALELPSDAHPLLHAFARRIDDLDAQIAKLTAKRAAVAAELVEKIEKWNNRPTRETP